MAYHVKTNAFEGPFDLLLALVSRQKLDVSTISISELADQYLAEVQSMGDVDLDVASDFMEVAASLLAIKAAALVPREWDRRQGVWDEEDEALEGSFDATTARNVLIERLLAYRQFRQAAVSLAHRQEREARMHPRLAGPEPEFLGLMPDFLGAITLQELARSAAELAGRRQKFLLEADHVALPRPPVALTTASVDRYTQQHETTTLSELLDGSRAPEDVVVTVLAILELYKVGNIDVSQRQLFGEISIRRLPTATPYEPDLSLWGEKGL